MAIPIWLIKLIIGIILTVAKTLIELAQEQDRKAENVGIRGTTTTGGTKPATFIVGLDGTAGHRIYPRMTWGEADKTPNAFLVDVIGLSMLPVRSLNRAFVNGALITLLTDEEDADKGFPAEEYRDADGVDHLWIKFYDGTQTTADAYLVAKFGSHSERPWESDMIGRGMAYAIGTARVNRELFPGFPEYRFEVNGIELDDTRGDEQHDNPIVAVRTLLKGLSYDDEWFYGPQKIGNFAVPVSTWEPEMDKCDVSVDLDGGGTEKAYRVGMEVSVDTEPHVVIGEFLKAANARIAELGGIYKVLVGAPNDAVKSFTDEDIVVTEEQTYDPFPGLEQTHNAITATYPEPGEAWEMKEAPPRYSSDLETADDGRRLVFSTQYKAAPYATQVQRLMQATIDEARRFRRHSHTHGPAWWEYEPLDAVTWTSERSGYSSKVFLITVMDDLDNCNQIVGLQEQDPTDYDWSSDQELAFSFTPIGNQPPEAQPIIDWAAEGVTEEINGKQRACIELSWDGDQPDVARVQWEVRRADNSSVIHTGNTESVLAGAALISHNIMSAETYEARGKYVPFSGRRTLWSDWLSVNTPASPYTDVSVRLQALQVELRDELQRREAEHDATVKDILTLVANILTANIDDVVERRSVEAQVGNAFARIREERSLRVSADEAFAQQLTVVESGITDLVTGQSANATAISSLTTSVSVQGNLITANATNIQAADARITVNADALADAASLITANANSINSANALIATLDGTVAGQATSISTLNSTVTAQGGQISSIATSLTAVAAVSNNGTASGLIRWRAVSAPSGVTTRFAIEGKATAGGAYRFAGAYLDVLSSSSRWLFVADQFIFTDGSATYTPVVISGGALITNDLRVNGAHIVDATITSAKIANAAITSAKIGTAAITNAKIGNLEVDTIKINYNAVAAKSSASASGVSVGPSYTTVASVTISNPSSAAVAVYCVMGGTFAAGSSAGAIQMRLINASSGASLAAAVGNANPGNAGSVVPFVGTVIDISAGSSATYRVQGRTVGDVLGSALSGYMVLEWNKR